MQLDAQNIKHYVYHRTKGDSRNICVMMIRKIENIIPHMKEESQVHEMWVRDGH